MKRLTYGWHRACKTSPSCWWIESASYSQRKSRIAVSSPPRSRTSSRTFKQVKTKNRQLNRSWRSDGDKSGRELYTVAHRLTWKRSERRTGRGKCGRGLGWLGPPVHGGRRIPIGWGWTHRSSMRRRWSKPRPRRTGPTSDEEPCFNVMMMLSFSDNRGGDWLCL